MYPFVHYTMVFRSEVFGRRGLLSQLRKERFPLSRLHGDDRQQDGGSEAGLSVQGRFQIPTPQKLSYENPMTRIVLVDDDDLFRESLAGNLLDSGFSVDDFPEGDRKSVV